MHARTLRPGNLYKTLMAYEPTSAQTAKGRVKETYSATPVEIKCVLAEAGSEERQRYQQLNRKVTHTLVQHKAPIIGLDWLVVNPDTKAQYRVRGIDPCSELNLYTIYYCEEVGMVEDRHNAEDQQHLPTD